MHTCSGSIVFPRRAPSLQDTVPFSSSLVLICGLSDTGTFVPLRPRILTPKQEPPTNFQQETLGWGVSQIRSPLIWK